MRAIRIWSLIITAASNFAIIILCAHSVLFHVGKFNLIAFGFLYAFFICALVLIFEIDLKELNMMKKVEKALLIFFLILNILFVILINYFFLKKVKKKYIKMVNFAASGFLLIGAAISIYLKSTLEIMYDFKMNKITGLILFVSILWTLACTIYPCHTVSRLWELYKNTNSIERIWLMVFLVIFADFVTGVTIKRSNFN